MMIDRRRLASYTLFWITTSSLADSANASDKPSPVSARSSHRPRNANESDERPWLALPSTPSLPTSSNSGTVAIGDVDLFFAEFGTGLPVIFLHGGMANSNYWGAQVAAAAQAFRVIAMDTRGHGRSTMSQESFSFSLFADDVVRLMDSRGIKSAAIVGWSDGAITGLDLAMKHPDRVTKLFCFGANYHRSSSVADGSHSPVFMQFLARCQKEYALLSSAPEQWSRLRQQLQRLWSSEPNYTKADLSRIKCPVAVVCGDHDEIISRSHSQSLTAAIPGANLGVLPNTSHFAMLQNPDRFNAEMMGFLSK